MELDVLCMVAHPDDAEIMCGGTLAKLSEQGYLTGIADFTQGEMGTRGTPEKRAMEAKCAAEILGVKIRVNLGFPDAFIENTVNNRSKVVRVIREYRPHLIITSETKTRNPDHMHTTSLVIESCFTAGLSNYDTGQELHRPNKIIFCPEYYETCPDFYVDITPQFEKKMRAIHCYSSQVHDPDSKSPPTYISSPKFLGDIEARFRYYGSKIHTGYAEAFRMDSPVEIGDLVEEIALRACIPGQGRLHRAKTERNP